MLNGPGSRGVSLIEVIVVLAIAGIAAGTIMRVATHQQRQYGRLAARSLALAQLREGGDVLASELAGISPSAGDIYDGGMGRASIDFRAPLASGVLCASPPAGADEIHLLNLSALGAALDTGNDAVSGAWVSPGDSLWIYSAAADTTGARDVWGAYLAMGTAHLEQSCAPHDDSADATVVRAVVSPAVPGSLETHAPVRVFRRARYALYRAGDARWYLGFSDCRPVIREPACAPMQPVAGPYLADTRSAASHGGLTFDYLDASGTPTADRHAVAAIVIHLRADAAAYGSLADTLTAQRTIGLRNTPR